MFTDEELDLLLFLVGFTSMGPGAAIGHDVYAKLLKMRGIRYVGQPGYPTTGYRWEQQDDEGPRVIKG